MTSSTTSAVTTAAGGDAAKDPLAAHDTLRLENKTLEKIIETWEEDLKEHRSEMVRQKGDLDAWDRSLSDVEDKSTALMTKVCRIEVAQDELAQSLDAVMGQQKELDQMLRALEGEVKVLYERDQGEGLGDEERHAGYFLAEKVDEQLGKIQAKLDFLVDKLNKQHAEESEDNPVSLIVQTLNAHLNTLQWIDMNAAAVQSRIAGVQKQFSQRQLELERLKQ